MTVCIAPEGELTVSSAEVYVAVNSFKYSAKYFSNFLL